VSRALRRAIQKDCKSAFAILGYTIEELRQHLESLFQEGMSWDNYGTHWHIDHVIPKSWFNLSSENGVNEYELKLCWSLSNLQPMWTSDNLEKKNAYIYHVKLGRLPITYEQFRLILEQSRRGDAAFTLLNFPTNTAATSA